ncbi:PhoD-like phosphatase-domain-containing protein [Crepidotus variabilis]|uniref:PhoD-like phosphatase-domain-containing protein n=1 Tax=Crepidotus variabilis TaxID=179855 RepID=A0A9P6EM55_9AGAR|nr:PhoD-like phosphatase-domain-containing protein [Crepidotus variabilis]
MRISTYGYLFQFFIGLLAARANLFQRNLAYESPFSEHPQLAHNTNFLHNIHLEGRQNVDAGPFKDTHYPSFYGSNLGNSPFVWGGGVNFTHAVASGDPYDTSVILWTRAFPTSSDGSRPDQSVPVCLKYHIGLSSNISTQTVDIGEAYTSYDVDWTVKVEAKNLRPDTKYFYRFTDCITTASSPVGITRTIAASDTPASKVNGGKPLTLAVFSCSQYQSGWFNAYGYAAQNTEADIFIHLGDYIYESLGNGAKIGRQTLGRELATIHDYRQRLSQYRTDQNLVLAHQNAPWITVADNAWKSGTANSNDTTEGCGFSSSGACFTDRKLAAVRAYHEWMPIRQIDAGDKLRIWRNFKIGKLLDLTMLDTRQYDRDVTDYLTNSQVVDSVADFDDRSIMGAAQEKWLLNTLSESKSRGAIWRIIGQQVIFSQLEQNGERKFGSHGVDDAWDGYRANRARVLDHLYDNKISNTVILAGDSHANWVSDLSHPNDTKTYNPQTGMGAIGVEFAGTAVTSGSSFGSGILPDKADNISRVLVGTNPDLQWSEGSFRGFFTLTVDASYLNATYYAMRNITYANLDGFISAQFIVKAGENKLRRPVAGGVVKAGVLKSQVVAGNL